MSPTFTHHTALPEDLEPLVDRQGHTRCSDDDPASVTLSNTGLRISRAALEMIGDPERVDLRFGRISRMLAVKPSQTGRKLGGRRSATNGRSIPMYGAFELLGMPRLRKNHGHRFIPQLVDGVLLIGPLPLAEGGEE